MQVIGFNFTKISGERPAKIIKPNRNINIAFKDVQKDKVDLLKDQEAIKVLFEYSLLYTETKKKDENIGKLEMNGEILLIVTKEESKEILKGWKNESLSAEFQVPLYNTIFKRCTPKAVYIADEIGLPSPVPIQRISPKKEG